MKKRYKLLFGFLITGIVLITIFLITRSKKINYLSIGDSLAIGQTPNNTISESYGDYVADYLKDRKLLKFYTKSFSKSGYRSVDILNDINSNKEISVDNKKITIKSALMNADVITISVGANDLFYKLNVGNEFDLDRFDDIYKYVDESFKDIDKLLREIKKSSKGQIMIFGFYNPFINFSNSLATTIEPIILYANTNMEELSRKYDITYLDIHDKFNANTKFLPNKLEIHPNKDGYRAMADIIIDNIDQKILAK